MSLLNWFKRRRNSRISPEERSTIKQEAFRKIDQLRKEASIARIGGFKPTEAKFTSRFSGNFLMTENENWPKWKNKYIESILQVNIEELPLIPPILQDYQLITIFIDPRNIPFNLPHGEGWEIRLYKDKSNLMERPNPNLKSKLKPFEIKWIKTNDEFPSMEDAASKIDLDSFEQLEDCGDIYYDNYTNHEYTKIGGWPSIIQHPLDMNVEDLVIQIGSESKAKLNWMDGGTVYIGFTNGQWKLECQSY
ncbi:MAG: DUF1963 domain-containing protein, partial [Bacteroidota bacterium]